MVDQEKLAPLKARRSTIKAQLTRFETYLDKFDSEKDKIFELKQRKQKIEPVLDTFNEIQTEIELIEEDLDNVREAFENKYFSLVGRVDEIIDKMVPSIQSTKTTNSINEVESNCGRLLNIKLPDINLPEFAGNYESWHQFQDTFNALINDNSNLSTIQKFYYLQSALKGNAAQVINNLEINELNYDTAWTLLKDRFDNKKLIIHSHLQRIFDLPINNKDLHSSLRKFLDEFLKHFRALQNLGEPVDAWNTILIHLLLSKLDFNTKKEWETTTKTNMSPTIDEFTKFLQAKCTLLETLSNKVTSNSSNFKPQHFKTQTHLATNKISCVFCKSQHYIFTCEKFLQLTAKQRLEQVKALKLCINCLRLGHTVFKCLSSSCKFCHKKHNSLLHFDNTDNTETNSTTESNAQSNKENQISLSNISRDNQNYILLSTAIILVVNEQGKTIKARALLDSGSQSNFITQNLVKKLNLKTKKVDFSVSGINQIATNIKGIIHCSIGSAYNSFTSNINALIVNQITDNIPQIHIHHDSIQVPSGIDLADPDFNEPNQIDVLLGASIFWGLLRTGQIKTSKVGPIMQNSVLGWLISGPIPNKSVNSLKCHLNTLSSISNKILSEQLERFWEIDNYSDPNVKYTEQELNCEQHFVDNTFKDKDGHFVVSLPFKDKFVLGESRELAIKRFKSVEKKLQLNESLYNQYRDFLTEYQALGHMTEIKTDEFEQCYLPHHSVIKAESLTCKLRVVFDASAKTTNGVSLNDVLMKGPIIQDDLFSVILRFRTHNIVLIADVSKMYRQIWVNQSDRKYQRIIWRNNSMEDLKHFELKTVTYGTTPASFLATRCLKQISLENKVDYPVACDVIANDFYMDDLLTGALNIESARLLKCQVEKLLLSAGFTLRKWVSNDPNMFSGSENSSNKVNYVISDKQNIKTLGMSWNSINDNFFYTIVKLLNTDSVVTKRKLISIIAQIFDPLGLLGPVIVTAKIIIQQLWKLDVKWDDEIPTDIAYLWHKFYDQLTILNYIEIPRQMQFFTKTEYYEIHGFSDASESAYGACVYLRSVKTNGQASLRLICAKSRVAPLKSLTLPKLELSGAVLLANLVEKVVSSMKTSFSNIHYWCDSTIVLAWIRGHPSDWKTFVANRVARIQHLTKSDNWHHVKSSQNPADLISRGCTSMELRNSNLWWYGPKYLSEPLNLSNFEEPVEVIPERKQKSLLSCVVLEKFDIFELYSNYQKLVRVTAYCLRFIAKLKLKDHYQNLGSLTPEEIERASQRLVWLAQRESFSNEIIYLEKSKSIPHNSRLASLNPFLDKNQIIRVGGRLANANIQYDTKFPMILPKKHKLTQLIVKHYHLKNLHGGAQLILSEIREQFWPLNGKQVVRKMLRDCIICFKVKPRFIEPLMGGFPASRINPSRPFLKIGIDFAGPYLVKDGRLKNRKLLKSYFCVFVCLVTKAIHLEPVIDLTTDNFLNALKRFVSRRGLCSLIQSDNATNFVGADNILKRVSDLTESNKFKSYLIENQIQWKFIPARSPHFGGIWEAAVKSTKSHLKVVMKNLHFTYEEFHTLLTQVEAILNSRPLTPLSNDPNDLQALTPGHFLIGSPLTSIPQRNLEEAKMSSLSRYQHMQQVLQHFWRRWSSEYLRNLQQRSKWRWKHESKIVVGSLVLLKEDNLPPQAWKMGRVENVHPGPDGIVRVVTIKTPSSVVRRAVTRVCLLPIEQ